MQCLRGFGSGDWHFLVLLTLGHKATRVAAFCTCGGNDDGDVDALMVLTRMVITDPKAYSAEKTYVCTVCNAHTHERFEPTHSSHSN